MLVNCGNDFDDKGCSANYEMFTRSVIMPDSIPYGTDAEITVIYFPPYYCSKFDQFREHKDGDTTYISVLGYEDECICENRPDSTASFTFSGFAKRDFVFRFIYPNDSVIEDTLRVY